MLTPNPEVLILTSGNDAHADAVCARLLDSGVPFSRRDTASLTDGGTISWSISGNPQNTGQVWNWLDPSGAELGFGSVRAVWYRRPGWPHLDRADPVPGGGADRPHDWGMLLAALWERLDAFWLPAPPHVLRRIAKPLQLLRARDLGLDIPDTLVSTDPDAVLAFYERHNGNVVSKRIGHLRPALSDDGFRYAEPFTRRDLRHAEAVRAAPVIFQEYVAKRLELRVTVVGEAVFTAAIHSQAANRTRYDWRHYDTASTPHRPHRLPDDVAARCVELVRSFGLAFGTLDLVLTPEGRHVFLEVNPNGQYLWIEHLTGLPISAAVAGLLGAEARAASRRAAGG